VTNRRWGFLVTLAIAVFGTASLAFAVVAYLKRLPDPETADRRGVFRWLVESDLRNEPSETQRVILRRVESELLKGIDFRDIASKLNDAQRRQLLENADLLAGLWFRRQADRYFGASTSDRPNVLGDQIAQIHRLGIIDQLSALENAGPANGGTATAATTLATRIDRWLAEASPHERPRLAQYFAAVRDRMFWDGIQNAANVRDWLPL
jgi:hypothetical protein